MHNLTLKFRWVFKCLFLSYIYSSYEVLNGRCLYPYIVEVLFSIKVFIHGYNKPSNITDITSQAKGRLMVEDRFHLITKPYARRRNCMRMFYGFRYKLLVHKLLFNVCYNTYTLSWNGSEALVLNSLSILLRRYMINVFRHD